MKVFELMKILGEFPANAALQIWDDTTSEGYEVPNPVFDGPRADDSFVNFIIETGE